jgi:serine/threonine protein kinase
MSPFLKYKPVKHRASVPELFELREKIGAGAFARVYKGVEKQNNKMAAVKVVDKYSINASQRELIQQ